MKSVQKDEFTYFIHKPVVYGEIHVVNASTMTNKIESTFELF